MCDAAGPCQAKARFTPTSWGLGGKKMWSEDTASAHGGRDTVRQGQCPRPGGGR